MQHRQLDSDSVYDSDVEYPLDDFLPDLGVVRISPIDYDGPERDDPAWMARPEPTIVSNSRSLPIRTLSRPVCARVARVGTPDLRCPPVAPAGTRVLARLR